jgi:excinuclease ABC subunit B
MNKFKLHSDYKPTPDQKRAIDKLVRGNKAGIDYQVLLGVTGSGKTFTIANVIERLQKPALIISHNKTLAAQLFQEFREYFPENAASFFVSYYDYYQPEAYIPSTDTYIEKDAGINELIDKLRLAATTNLLTRSDTIVVASVSCIYNIGSPNEYGDFAFEFSEGLKINRAQIIDRLIDLQYERSDFGFHRGTFRIRGDTIDIYPAYQNEGVRIELGNEKIKKLRIINPISGQELPNYMLHATSYTLFPAKHFVTDSTKNKPALVQIKKDLNKRIKVLKSQGEELEAHRLKQRVTYDLEMIAEVGYVKGIENYSRYFDGRKKGDPPYSLLDYFSKLHKKSYSDSETGWLVFVDESHITFPQIRGMHAGDLSRKKTLIEHGFRLPSALDNRPLKFEEFMRKIPNFIATSATPADWEISMANDSYNNNVSKSKVKKSGNKISNEIYINISDTKDDQPKNKGVTQQLLRPTGIPDPKIDIKPAKTQVADVIGEIRRVVDLNQRVLVTTLTKRTAEDLSQYLKEQGVDVAYLHSDIKTLERSDILDNLRRGKYDCLVGVNLLREGLDLPEVSLVAILDADKEGFLRSEVSLIQTMGRAARHVDGKVILYADRVTGSMKRAIAEVERRRKYQLVMNKKYGIKPRSIKKPIRERLIEREKEIEIEKLIKFGHSALSNIDVESLTPLDKKRLVSKLRREMQLAARDLNFELAAEIRDRIASFTF